MLGCHSTRLTSSSSSSSSSAGRSQWPTDNGTACLCYDTANAECIATCAADISNHHVRHTNGTGLVTASCPQGTTVLGCGSASPTGGQSRRRAAVVAMRTSCRCYDDHQVTCYAVCGLFMAESSYGETGRLVGGGNSARCDSFCETTVLCVLGLLLILTKQD